MRVIDATFRTALRGRKRSRRGGRLYWRAVDREGLRAGILVAAWGERAGRAVRGLSQFAETLGE